MIKINWLVRLKNKAFWMSFIPAAFLLAETIAAALGHKIDLDYYGVKTLNIVNAIFTLLAILGIIEDPTTKGVGDSERAMTYKKPN